MLFSRSLVMALAYYDDGSSGGGIIGAIKSFMDTLPPWLSTLITAVAFLGLAAIVGWIIGKIVGGILYPDPDKQSVLSKSQKFIFLGAFVLTFGIVIFSLTYTPKEKLGDSLPVDGDGFEDPFGGEPEIIGNDEDGNPIYADIGPEIVGYDEEGNPIYADIEPEIVGYDEDGNPIYAEDGNQGDFDNDATVTPNPSTTNGGGTSVYRGGGGGVVMVERDTAVAVPVG